MLETLIAMNARERLVYAGTCGGLLARWARYTYEVWVAPRRPCPGSRSRGDERADLAAH